MLPSKDWLSRGDRVDTLSSVISRLKDVVWSTRTHTAVL